MSRIFSKNSYNGYFMISVSEEPKRILLFGKKSATKDEEGYEVSDVLEVSEACHAGWETRSFSPWHEWVYVPSVCQKCPWVYAMKSGQYGCILKEKDKSVNPSALVVGKK